MRCLEEIQSNKGKSSAVFNLRDKVLGKKKGTQEQVAVINPETGQYVYTAKEIKQVSLNYCVNLLRKKEPPDEFKDIVANNLLLHKS